MADKKLYSEGEAAMVAFILACLGMFVYYLSPGRDIVLTHVAILCLPFLPYVLRIQ